MSPRPLAAQTFAPGAMMPATFAPGGAAGHAMAQRDIAELQTAAMMAQHFPRDPQRSLDALTVACQREGLAEDAFYSFAIGGKEVEGGTIRYAEEVARAWRYIFYSWLEVERRPGQSIIVAQALDVQTLTKSSAGVTLDHVRSTRGGNYRIEDPREIGILVASQAARLVRECIHHLVPSDVWAAGLAQCEATLSAKADTSPEGLARVLQAFAPHGVAQRHIEALIQRRFEAITPAQVVGLRKTLTQILDGLGKPGDYFPLLAQEQREAVEKGGDADKASPSAADSAPMEQAKAAIRERAAKRAAPKLSYAELVEQLKKCTTTAAVAAVLDTAQHLPEGQQADLREFATTLDLDAAGGKPPTKPDPFEEGTP